MIPRPRLRTLGIGLGIALVVFGVSCGGDGGGDPGGPGTSGEFDFTFELPASNAHFQDTLAVQVLVQGVHTLSAVHAEIGGTSTAMTYQGPSGTAQRWSAKLPTAALPHGAATLTVTAFDVEGDSGKATRPVVHNAPPTLTVTSPWDTALAAPRLHVQAACADDGPTPCLIKVFRMDPGGMVLLATKAGAIDSLLDFASINGFYQMLVTGTDSDGDSVQATRTVLRQVRSTLTHVASVDGRILDYDGARVLYIRAVADSFQLAIRTVSSGAEELIPVKSKFGFFRGRLHPTGAVFTRDLSQVVNKIQGTGSLHRWASGAATELVASRSYEQWNGHTSVTTEGDYFVFGVTEVQMSTGTLTTLPGNPSFVELDVGDNGDVAVSINLGFPDNLVRLYRGGLAQYTDSAYTTAPMTDGGRVIYNDQDPSGNYRSRLIDSLGNVTTLAGAAQFFWVPQGGHAMKYGWIAFSDSASRIWTRSPAGVDRLVSAPGYRPLAVGPHGEVIYADDPATAYYYVGTASIVASEIGVAIGRVFWVGNTPYKITYNTILQVSP